MEEALQTFLSEQGRLLGVAYRVTGDHFSAQDVLQEAWVRWQGTDRPAVRNPAAFLTTTTTRLALNFLQSAPRRHETPSDRLPVRAYGPEHDPSGYAEAGAAIEQCIHVLMAKLSTTELAAYLLRKGFDYPYDEIARMLAIGNPHARQLVHRAQLRIQSGKMKPVDGQAHRQLVQTFRAAALSGEIGPLIELMHPRCCVTTEPAISPLDVARNDRTTRDSGRQVA